MEESVLMTVTDVMQELKIGRPTAERLLRQFLGKKRVKGQKYLVPRKAFYDWLNNGMK